MKWNTGILYFLAGVLILTLMMFIRADKHFQYGLYDRFIGIMLAVMFVFWLAGSLAIWKRLMSCSIGAALIHWLGVLSLTIFISAIIEHFVLSRLLSNYASQPRFSLFVVILFWLESIIFYLGGHLFFLFCKMLFNSTPTLRVIGIVLVSLFVLVVAFVLITNYTIRRLTRSDIYPLNEITTCKMAIVFGAGVWSEAVMLSAVLEDWIKAVIELYRAGKVMQNVLSGTGVDGGLEVEIMEEYALDSGIPAEALFLDPLGVRTYATCQQIRDRFGTDEVVLVTQNFHLSRALYLCNVLGVQSVGLSADLRTYSPLNRATWAVREAIATAYAWLEVTFFDQLS